MSAQPTEHPASPHPALAGREGPARRLADALRELIAVSVTVDAPGEERVAVAAELEALARRLRAHVPDPPPARFISGPRDEDPTRPIGEGMPYDIIVGPYNPLAPPVTLEFDPPVARGRVRFTVPYEGAPGCVHGAALAGTFDIVLTAANALSGVTGPTVRLALRFRRPTRLAEEAVFEAWVTERTERRVFSQGRIVQGDVVTVEAEGEFAVLDAARVARLADRTPRAGRDTPT